MNYFIRPLLFILCFVSSPVFSQVETPEPPLLTDENIIERISKPIEVEHEASIFQHKVDTHEAQPWIAVTYYCYDACPKNTKRVIFYLLNAYGSSCNAPGAEWRTIFMNSASRTIPQTFCFPKVIIDNWEKFEKCDNLQTIEQCKSINAK